MQRFGKSMLWGFSISLTLILFAAVEAGLRMLGTMPGDVSPRWANFHKVDSLVIKDEFLADSNGIMYANPALATVWGRDINESGFPSIPITDASRPSVMLIGDSFVWGMTASHLDSSFAIRIQKETDWTAHNFGIPATDPVQYALIAQHHLPTVNPEVVMVFFFMGNDIMFYDRPVKPYRPQFVVTNAGAIMLDIEGKRFENVHDAYDHLLFGRYHVSGNASLFDWFIGYSALLSRLYAIKFRVQEKIFWEQGIHDLSVSNGYLLKIKKAAESNGAAFQIIIIPERKEANMHRDRYEQRYQSFLNHPELRAHIHWPETSKDMYVPYPDAHLNDYGHRVYADFIERLLEDMMD